MAPFYDVLSVWPVIEHGSNLLPLRRAELAMAVRGKRLHRKLHEIRPYHWDWAARLAGMGDAKQLVGEVLDQVPGVLRSVDQEVPTGFPRKTRTSIFERILKQAEKLKR